MANRPELTNEALGALRESLAGLLEGHGVEATVVSLRPLPVGLGTLVAESREGELVGTRVEADVRLVLDPEAGDGEPTADLLFAAAGEMLAAVRGETSGIVRVGELRRSEVQAAEDSDPELIVPLVYEHLSEETVDRLGEDDIVVDVELAGEEESDGG